MSKLTEQDSISDQFDTILKNRYRRFKYLQRNNRMEDAIAIADEFIEWIDPDFHEVAHPYENDENAIKYFCLDELEQIHEFKMLQELSELNNEE